MKREIKFRAWDKIEHQMLFSGMDYQLRLISHIYQDEFADESVIGFSRLDWDRFDLMQFTGLKDKNGKEIYEGDILKGINGLNIKVDWSNHYASFALKREGWAFAHFFGEAIEGDKCEVIGNIYENPELLNQ